MMHIDVKAFGEQVRLLREDSGFSQGDLAKLVDVDRSHISYIESGNREPSLSLLLRICDVTGGYIEMGKVEWNGKR